ncbi:hypothetical protein Droror1_Dr00014325 [Drosera rotundifolia]
MERSTSCGRSLSPAWARQRRSITVDGFEKIHGGLVFRWCLWSCGWCVFLEPERSEPVELESNCVRVLLEFLWRRVKKGSVLNMKLCGLVFVQLKDDENMDSSNFTTPPAPNDQVIEKPCCSLRSSWPNCGYQIVVALFESGGLMVLASQMPSLADGPTSFEAVTVRLKRKAGIIPDDEGLSSSLKNSDCHSPSSVTANEASEFSPEQDADNDEHVQLNRESNVQYFEDHA